MESFLQLKNYVQVDKFWTKCPLPQNVSELLTTCLDRTGFFVGFFVYFFIFIFLGGGTVYRRALSRALGLFALAFFGSRNRLAKVFWFKLLKT